MNKGIGIGIALAAGLIVLLLLTKKKSTETTPTTLPEVTPLPGETPSEETPSTGGQYQCPYDNLTFATWLEMANHILSVHPGYRIPME